jgi:zinc transport system permease protein
MSLDYLINIVAEPLGFEFMRTGLICAVLLAVMCAVLGSLLVTRGLSLLGDGLAHATFGGVGIALLLGATMEAAVWFSLPSAVLVAVAVVALGRRTKMASDSLVGVFFAIALAIGIATIHTAARRGTGVDVESVLFGNILGIESSEMTVVASVSLVVLLMLSLIGTRLAYANFYGELAQLSGVRVAIAEYILLITAAVVAVIAARSVGIMLVNAWLVIPATIGRHLSRQFGVMIFIAVGSAVLGSCIGLILSYHYDIPGGAAMTLALGGLFVIALMIKGLESK